MRYLFYKNKSPSVTVNFIISDRTQLTTKMSQGEIEYLDEQKYLKDFKTTEKSQHHNYPRIAMQGMTGANDKTRIVMSLVPQGFYLANSCNYVFAPKSYEIESLLGILNSKLINWYFRCFSTNSNVNGYEIDNLPIPYIGEDAHKTLKQLVLSIIDNKQKNRSLNTLKEESKIDRLVYQLYGLTYDEVLVVDPDTPITREEYETNYRQ